MDKRVQELWANALESDEFIQARSAMSRMTKEGQSYCCLGVLCELYSRETGNDGWKPIPKALPELIGQEFNFDGYTICLPEDVMVWAGLEERNPVLIPKNHYLGESHRAVEVNDNMCYTFPEIAKLVRKL